MPDDNRSESASSSGRAGFPVRSDCHPRDPGSLSGAPRAVRALIGCGGAHGFFGGAWKCPESSLRDAGAVRPKSGVRRPRAGRTILGLAAGAWLLAGCTTTSQDLGTEVDSVAKAGVTSFRQNDAVATDGSYTREVEATFGKEYESFTLKLGVDAETGELKALEVTASGVLAFEGQAAAGAIVQAIRESLSERDIAISEAAFPIIQDIITGALTGGASLPASVLSGQ